MQSIAMNKGNWTGEKHDLNYDSDSGDFEVYGETYKLSAEVETDGFISRDLVDPSGNVICSVCKDGEIWFCTAYDVSRADANPFVAAAQLLFTIV